MTFKTRLATALLLAAATTAAMAQPKVEAAWSRPTVQGQKAGGSFLRIESPTADRLVGGSSPVAGRVELHTMKMEGDVMRMREVDGIEVPAGQAVALQPGGLHLMLMDLKSPLKAGDRFPLTLKFEKAGEVPVQVEVRAAAPGAASGGKAEAEGHGSHKH